MTIDTSQYKPINRKLMSHCSELFDKALEQGLDVPDIFYKIPSKATPIYMYPSDLEVLTEVTEVEEDVLKDMGWYDPTLLNKPFVIWYGKKQIQLCEVKAHTFEFSKPKRGLNKDIPYLYSLCAQNKERSPYVVVVDNPIHASLLHGLGISAVACGSMIPTKAQIGYLARLGCKLIYIAQSQAKFEQAAELFIHKLAKFTDIGICLIDDWEVGLLSDNLSDTIAENATEGIEFLSRRILKKHNGKDDYGRSIELIETAQNVGNRNHARFLHLAKGHGSTNYAHFAESLHLMGDLIQANVPVESARKITIDRFGVSIFLRDQNQVKLS